MTPRIVMLLGRTVWTRDLSGWRHETVGESAGMSRDAVARLADMLSVGTSRRTIAVFEPDGLAHQTAETPKVKRAVFASLARVRSEHPVVESENLGWGIEFPDAGPSGTYSTMIHSELTPGLVHLRDACVRSGCQLPAAWTAYTAAVSCAKSGNSVSKARFALLLTPEFASVAAFGAGKRSFKAWVGKMAERDWKALSALIGDFEAGASPSMAETARRRGSIVVIAEGEPEKTCPIWRDLQASGRVDAVMDMDALALSASRIPMTHPANLIEAFPKPRELDRYLTAAAITGFSAAITLCAVVVNEAKRVRAEGDADRARAADLGVRLTRLNENQREMIRLRNQAPDETGSLPLRRYEALIGLAAAIPDALTLNSLKIGRDGTFELAALVVGMDFDPEGTRLSLERCGFVAASDKGWVFDSAAGRLLVRGKYGRIQQ